MESYSDRETVETQESMVDNFTKAEPSRVTSGQDDDGYAQVLYTLCWCFEQASASKFIIDAC